MKLNINMQPSKVVYIHEMQYKKGSAKMKLKY